MHYSVPDAGYVQRSEFSSRFWYFLSPVPTWVSYRVQYDRERDDAKITIPESIGYIKLLIDRSSIPLGERKELLVTLANQNPELVQQKLSKIRSELSNDNISQEQVINKIEFHGLLSGVDDNKVNKLFKEILAA